VTGRTYRSAALAGVVLLFVAAAASAADGTLKGKVSFREKPLAGAVVQLWSNWQGGFRGIPDAATPTAADEQYAFYGGNPVAISAAEALSIGVNAATVIAPEQATLPGGTGIRGKVYVDGAPLDRARVTVY